MRRFGVRRKGKPTAAAAPALTNSGGVGPDDFERDQDMDSLVAATRLQLGSRCLETGDYAAGILAYTAALQHAPLGARAAEARRGLIQCQKGQKLEALGEQAAGDAGVEAALEHLGVPQWGDPASPVRQTQGSEPQLEPEPEQEPRRGDGQGGGGEPVLVTRAALLTQVDELQQQVTQLQNSLEAKDAALVKSSEDVASAEAKRRDDAADAKQRNDMRSVRLYI